MESSQLSDVVRHTDVISYVLPAEINYFHSERAIDFRLAMQNYLKEQISFYQKVRKLRISLQTLLFLFVLLFSDASSSSYNIT
jgi:sorting nexin-9/18/33